MSHKPTDTVPAPRGTLSLQTIAMPKDANANGELNQGENVVMSLVVHNYHAAAVSPSFTLSTASPYITITDGAQASATIMEDADATLTSAFAFSSAIFRSAVPSLWCLTASSAARNAR